MSSGAHHVDPSQLSPQERGDAAQQDSFQDSLKQETEKALKQSLKHSINGSEFNHSLAVDQLTLLREASPTPELQDKLTKLIELIQHTNPQQLLQIGQLQGLIETAFAHEAQPEVEFDGVNVTLNQQQQNPFKIQNPFAPKVPDTSATLAKSNHRGEDKPDTEDSDDEKSAKKKRASFWAKVKELLG